MKREVVITFITSVVFIVLFLTAQHFLHPARTENEPLKIGFVYDGDESIPYTNNIMRAQRAAEEKFGDKITVVIRANVPGTAVADALESLVAEGCRLIFTTSYAHTVMAKACAQKYPAVQFCQATGDNANDEPVLKNFHTFMGAIYQGRYVSGIVAGLKLKERIDAGALSSAAAKIGYVAAYPYAEVISGYTAFLLGVRSVVPTATMTVAYTYTWGNFSREKQCAERLIAEDCVIIAQHSDTSGPAVACEEHIEKQVFTIGYNQSMISIAPTTSLISTRINWIPYVTGAVEAVLSKKSIEKTVKGNVHGNDIGAGFDLDWVQMLDLNSVIAAEGTAEKIAETIQAFKKGKVHVFQGDYRGVHPFDATDTYDLRKEFKENAKQSAPSFCYVLQDVITVEE